jgi:predicted transcriptional regulator
MSEYLNEVKSYKPTGCLPLGNRKDQNYQIKDLQDIHKEIIRLIFLGMKNVDIAESLGITAQTVSNTRNSSLAQRELALMQASANHGVVDISKRLKELQAPAIEALARILDPESVGVSPSVTSKAAFGILDRCGHSPVHKIASVSGKFTQEDMDEIKRKAREFGPIVSDPDEESSIESKLNDINKEIYKDVGRDDAI